MNIDKEGILYFFAAIGGATPADNICKFTRQVVMGLLLFLLIIILSSYALYVLTIPWVNIVLYLATGNEFAMSPSLFVVGVISYSCGIAIAASVGIVKLFQRLKKKGANKPKQNPSTWSVVMAMISARHNKICFKLNFTEETNENMQNK